jgi:hypothetical protein
MLDAAGRIWILPAKDAPERPEKAAPPPIDDDWSMVE